MARLGDHGYWKAALVTLGAVALASALVRGRGFWSSYVLDIVGPAWIYILVRGQFSRKQPAMLSALLSPGGALAIVLAACFLIEAAQYLRLYDARFDRLDLVAYVSLVLPCYMVERWLIGRRTSRVGAAS